MASDGGGDRRLAKAAGSSVRVEAGQGDDGHEDGWGRWSIRSKSEYRIDPIPGTCTYNQG